MSGSDGRRRTDTTDLDTIRNWIQPSRVDPPPPTSPKRPEDDVLCPSSIDLLLGPCEEVSAIEIGICLPRRVPRRPHLEIVGIACHDGPRRIHDALERMGLLLPARQARRGSLPIPAQAPPLPPRRLHGLRADAPSQFAASPLQGRSQSDPQISSTQSRLTGT